jgi:hypothetical protein
MVRLIVFAIAYPLLCVLLFFAINLTVPNAEEMLSIIGFGHAITLLPALIIAFIDMTLERFAHRFRPFWTALTGFCMLPGLFFLLFPAHRFGYREVLLFGGIGALSVFCCWLLSGWAGQKWQAQK